MPERHPNYDVFTDAVKIKFLASSTADMLLRYAKAVGFPTLTVDVTYCSVSVRPVDYHYINCSPLYCSTPIVKLDVAPIQR